MPSMESLDLSDNMLTGTIPEFSFPNLILLDVSGNSLSGTIPNLEFLYAQRVFLSRNNLTGTIPSLNIPNVNHLHLDTNRLTGTIPNFYLEFLQDLFLYRNQLSGKLPGFNLPSLLQLDVSENQLEGVIPILSLPNLERADLFKNRFTGMDAGNELARLATMDLSENRLTGFSEEMVLPSLTSLDLSNNVMTGTMPSYVKIPFLVRIDASSNYFVAIAEQVSVNLQILLVSNNNLREKLPDLRVPQLNYLDLSFNYLSDPLPFWGEINNLERFILSPNVNLTGGLPGGMDTYDKIIEVDIEKTLMKSTQPAILPAVLRPNGQYQLRNSNDKYQCPIIGNPLTLRSNIYIDPVYYDFVNCRCLPGTFGQYNNCIKCPEGCTCEDGLSIKGCSPTPNLQDMRNLLLCPKPEVCNLVLPSETVIDTRNITQEAQTCDVGYQDRICSRCMDGYGAEGRSCTKCGDPLDYIGYVLAPVYFIAFIIYLYKSGERASGKVNIIIFHVQTLSVIVSVMSTTKSVDRSINFAFSLGAVKFPNVSCFLGTTSAFGPTIFSFIRIPLIVVIGFLAFKLTKGFVRDKVVFITLNLARFIYYDVAIHALAAFGCTLEDEGNETWYLNAWPWISCSPSSTEYDSLLAFSIPVFFVFVCGFPMYLWLVIRSSIQYLSQDTVDDEEVASYRTRFGFLDLPYKKGYEFWELVVIIRLLCFAIVIRTVPYSNISLVFVLLLFAMQISIWLIHTHQPYKDSQDNTMALVSSYVIFFSYFIALVYGVEGETSPVMIIVIIINTLMLAFFVWLSLSSTIGVIKSRSSDLRKSVREKMLMIEMGSISRSVRSSISIS
eukprot:TRINITY_DN4139_c0_g1_i6.p1 TRINITY_DN4139_c0_g1~~TRINITY_DN4139_c0_g1_i6.p1  ORF type:complete len:835 (+),score=112.78 TRINITY_DN4139_c0_g1_i6:130-2634(+)